MFASCKGAATPTRPLRSRSAKYSSLYCNLIRCARAMRKVKHLWTTLVHLLSSCLFACTCYHYTVNLQQHLRPNVCRRHLYSVVFLPLHKVYSTAFRIECQVRLDKKQTFCIMMTAVCFRPHSNSLSAANSLDDGACAMRPIRPEI